MNKDIAIFIEISNFCKFNCSGCNINKTLKSNNLDINKLFRIFDFFDKKNIDNITFLLGPGNFLINENLNYFNKIAQFNNLFEKRNYKITLLGNISTDILSDKIKDFFINNKKFVPGIILNPLMDNKYKKIFFKNIDKLKNIFFINELTFFTNLSKEYFNNNNSIKQIFDFLKKIGDLSNFDYFNDFTLIFNPNKLLIQKKEFQIDLKTQTEWYINFWNENYKTGKIFRITYEGIVNMYYNTGKLYIEPYYIDKNLNLYPIIEHIGDLILNNSSKNYKILNIEKDFEISEKDFLNKLNKMNKKIIIDNKKKLLKDDLCKNCEYIDFCSKQSIAINKEIYKNTLLGQETKDYCLGHKKLNDYILENYNNHVNNKIFVINKDNNE